MIKQIKDAFLLSNSSFSYLIRINHAGIPTLEHFGRMINPNEDNVSSFYFDDSTCRGREVRLGEKDDNISLFSSHNEFSTSMLGDYTYPGIELESNKGEVFSFKFVSFRINEIPEKMNGLPSFRGGEELVLVLSDDLMGVNLELHYVLFETTLGRYSKIINESDEPITLKRCLSYEISLENDSFYLYNIYGHWANEGNIDKTRITHNRISFGSTTGSSCDFVNPFFMVASKNANLEYGDVYGFNLVYSSSFESNIELTPYNRIKISSGIDFSSFKLNLSKDEEFISPMGVITYSSLGLNGIALNFHPFVLDHLMNENLAKTPRPISFNNWEATTFDFDENKIISLMKKASSLGIELFVLDDGWFGKRNDDSSSLGDWKVNLEKINLKEVIDYAHSLKMKFGLWIEPEMISPNSELFKKYPSFAMFNRKTEPTLLRHQLVLDLTNKEVIDYVFNEIASIFDNYEIDYCKWDFNRFLSEVGTYGNKINEGEIYHRFILGTYELLNRFKNRYPEILLETCASGGGRFDFGMLYYSPQIWCSDETNPYSRATIQYATNMFYPLSSIGSHVSESEALSIQDKAIVAAFGTFGYELDILKLSDKEKEEIKNITKLIKDWHFVVTSGDYYALSSPYESNFSSWNVVTKDKKVCLVFNFGYKRVPTKTRFLKIKGLDKNKYYFNSLTNDVYKGEFYMNVGLNLSAPLKEGMTMLFVLKEVNVIIKTIVNKKAKAQKREKLL